jgi:exodeoxyribonuclease VII small subunit
VRSHLLPGKLSPEPIKVIMPNKPSAASATASATQSAAGTPDRPPESFEQAMAELAQLVTQMEGGQLPLEASVAAYARGSELVRYCAAQLEKVESQVKVLEGDMLKPFSTDGEDDE